jgi:predicted DNA binding protein
MENAKPDTKPKHRAVAKREAEKTRFLEALKKTPIVQLASQQSGLPSRATYYRWRKEDSEFAKAADDAIGEGVELVSDLAETKLIAAIKDGDFNAIRFWLKNRDPDYAEKLQIQAKVESTDKSLTPEQEAVIRRAIELAQLKPSYGQHETPALPSSPEGSGSDRDP